MLFVAFSPPKGLSFALFLEIVIALLQDYGMFSVSVLPRRQYGSCCSFTAKSIAPVFLPLHSTL